jgi:hypothetical protein
VSSNQHFSRLRYCDRVDEFGGCESRYRLNHSAGAASYRFDCCHRYRRDSPADFLIEDSKPGYWIQCSDCGDCDMDRRLVAGKPGTRQGSRLGRDRPTGHRGHRGN